jgi:hypothetical protein
MVSDDLWNIGAHSIFSGSTSSYACSLSLQNKMSKLLDLIEQNAIKQSRSKTMSSSSSSSGGISFTGALTILFIGLKLTHVINWSWWWVLSPIWISLSLVLFILAVVLTVAIIAQLSR